MKKKVYIIGAGLAGLSAAYHLVKNGHRDIEIFEASPQAGGRCRSYFDEKLQAEIDNGNHLIMQANTNVLDIITSLGVDDKFNKFEDNLFTFFDNRNGERYYYKAPLPDIETYGILNFLNLIRFILLPSNKTVKSSFKIGYKFYERVINPISRSILNTSSEVADSKILRKVFWKILRTKNGFSYYYPKNNWNDALIKPLTEFLESNGVKINYNKRVKELEAKGQSLNKIFFDSEEIYVEKDTVIMSAPPYSASKLLNKEDSFPNEFGAIINVHFKFVHSLPAQIIGVTNANIEWVFIKPDMLSTTYSASENKMSEAEIAKDAWEVCSKVLGLDKNKMPEYRVLVEKRATFICTKQQLAKRPSQKTNYSNLFLSGDYVANGLPATIEGAVASGKKVVELTKYL